MKRNHERVPTEIDNIQITLKSLPNNSSFSISMRQMLGSLMNSRIFLKITQDDFGQESFLGIPIQISRCDRIKINDNIYYLTPGIYKALSSTSYNGKTMKNESENLMMKNIINDLGYTGKGDKSSKRNFFFTIELPKKVEEVQTKAFD